MVDVVFAVPPKKRCSEAASAYVNSKRARTSAERSKAVPADEPACQSSSSCISDLLSLLLANGGSSGPWEITLELADDCLAASSCDGLAASLAHAVCGAAAAAAAIEADQPEEPQRPAPATALTEEALAMHLHSEAVHAQQQDDDEASLSDWVACGPEAVPDCRSPVATAVDFTFAAIPCGMQHQQQPRTCATLTACDSHACSNGLLAIGHSGRCSLSSPVEADAFSFATLPTCVL